MPRVVYVTEMPNEYNTALNMIGHRELHAPAGEASKPVGVGCGGGGGSALGSTGRFAFPYLSSRRSL
eukprot:CAMPEP_0197848550 /NCGR_PEP_ID=MMETSP1438-20131217/9075_1 /TAXON_ID=1461541 /ORGANISM="Pterosperma sp., Strain CCMP1384" /LENGTH=66 /DNA_ID=CAMNT_0043460847 /DNA_START=57 /DNA_END=254 /DNA_ORIENTATION=-